MTKRMHRNGQGLDQAGGEGNGRGLGWGQSEGRFSWEQGFDMKPGGEAMIAKQDWEGRYVVCRCHNAGVHAGVLVRRNGAECELKDARRLWRWRVAGNKGISLSDVATHGLDKRDTRLGAPVQIILTEVCEYIECTDNAKDNISAFPTYAP